LNLERQIAKNGISIFGSEDLGNRQPKSCSKLAKQNSVKKYGKLSVNGFRTVKFMKFLANILGRKYFRLQK
jgi:hypothetical protein